MLVAGNAIVIAPILPAQSGDGQGVHQALSRVSLRYGESRNRKIIILRNIRIFEQGGGGAE